MIVSGISDTTYSLRFPHRSPNFKNTQLKNIDNEMIAELLSTNALQVKAVNCMFPFVRVECRFRG